MLVKPKFLFLVLCVKCVCSLLVYTPTVEISQGKLRGIRGLNGQHQYYGIPYATVERFQPPKPPKNWNKLFYAVLQFNACAQEFEIFRVGTENCLEVDIYTPAYAKRGHKLPVLIFFHGGAYYAGTKWQFDGEFLVKHDVIVVVANYRLGVLGFMCLNNVANLGLKDQVAALKWVRKNIVAFGGDPDNVTLSGQSAGAASSSLLFLAKQAGGLYHKAILMSGVALAPWAFNLDYLKPLFKDASKIRKVRDENDVYNTFLKAPLDDILAATHGTLVDHRYFKYTPCDDRNFTDSFFHDTPYNMIKSGDFYKVPMMIGITNVEGILFHGLNTQETLDNLDNNLPDMLSSMFSWCSKEDKRRIADRVRSHYFGKHKIANKAAINGYIELYSDYIVRATTDAFVQLMATYSDKPIYNYLFSYEGERNFVKALLYRGSGLRGTTHAEDLLYLFKPVGITLVMSDADKLLIDRYTKMWTNFMKYGDPTPNVTSLLPVRWPVTTTQRLQTMRIDTELSVFDTPDITDNFYLRLLCTYGRSGYVPCESAMQCNLDQ